MSPCLCSGCKALEEGWSLSEPLPFTGATPVSCSYKKHPRGSPGSPRTSESRACWRPGGREELGAVPGSQRRQHPRVRAPQERAGCPHHPWGLRGGGLSFVLNPLHPIGVAVALVSASPSSALVETLLSGWFCQGEGAWGKALACCVCKGSSAATSPVSVCLPSSRTGFYQMLICPLLLAPSPRAVPSMGTPSVPSHTSWGWFQGC